MKKLLYVCEADSGGIMEYAIRQTAAIAHEGIIIHFLCRENFPVNRLSSGIGVSHFVEFKTPLKAIGKLRTIWNLTFGQRQFAKQVCSTFDEGHFDAVLFTCFKEYFAPFWVGPLRRLARRGVVIGTIAHDPVRDFVVGPLWWHRWSVRLGYSFVQHVFVHDATPVDFGGKRPEAIKVHQIPHGPYEVAEPKIGRLEMRRRLGFDSGLTSGGTGGITSFQSKDLPHRGTAHTEREASEAWPRLCSQDGASESGSLASGLADSPVCESLTRSASASAFLPATSYPPLATPAPPDVVFLAFGQIRDGKNLDLFLRAMTQVPDNIKLMVAGKGDSGSSRPAEYYQKLAQELGVAKRCRWDIRRIPDEEVGDIFAACDVVLVTYSAKFRSASGVLNAAVSGRKPVLASSGSGPLKTALLKYGLGVFVEPDDIGAIVQGVLKILAPTLRGYDLPMGRFAVSRESEIIGPNAEWGLYEKENSWSENAGIVLEAFAKQITKDETK